MKKHIFAFICVFVILFNTLSFKEAHAMDIGVAIDVGSDILYQGWDMLNSILNGAIISFSPYTQYADKASAMAAFYNDWGNILEQLTGGTIDQDPAITFGDTTYPLDYGMSYDTMNYFVDEYGRILDQSPADPYYFPMLISPETYAEWNRYQNSWIGKYIDAFKPSDDRPVPTPDVLYSTLLDYINGTGFWFKSFPLDVISTIPPNAGLRFHNQLESWTNYSWVTWSNSNFNNGNYTASNVLPFNISDINIVSYNDAYSFYLDVTPIINKCRRYDQLNNAYDYTGFQFTSTEFTGNNIYPYNTTTFTYNGNLFEVLQYVSNKFKNVNIYVDGVPWSYANDISVPDPPVLAPDIIRIGEDGPVLRNDVFIPNQDLYADVIGWTNLVDDKILDGGTIGFDDLIDAGVLTDAEGNIITDENRDEYFKKRDIASVITDELVDADLDNLLPPAPSPPDDDPSNWHFPTIVIPDGGDPDPKHTGLSVLARIVNVTNQSMPAEVMTMFWGICITLVILGIIKILHK